jgi:ubiquinone/menaquinone biosynthesis C-methylase UbiE
VAHADYDGVMAQVYDRGRTLPDASVHAWVVAAAHHLAPGPGPVLDLGAGTGRFSGPLAEGLETTIIGLEPAGGMRAGAVTKPAASSVALVAGSAEALPFGDKTFRGVWASQVIHHLPDLEGCAGELRRILVVGGRLLVRGLYDDVPTRWVLGRYFPEAIAIAEQRFPSLATIRHGLASAGFAELAHDQIDQVVADTPEAFYQRTALRADSALALLSDPEFEAGLSRLRADIDQDALSGPVSESLDLLVFE